MIVENLRGTTNGSTDITCSRCLAMCYESWKGGLKIKKVVSPSGIDDVDEHNLSVL